MKNNIHKAYFAGGCFWGVENCFQNTEGVIATKVGYMGGHMDNPTYENVCIKNTGHAETLEITFDSSLVTFKDLAKLFFEIHDPTQKNRQGPDVGDQYRSAIFYVDEEQKMTSQDIISILKGKGYDIVTELSQAETFWEAEEYHQKYYSKMGSKPYCHVKKQLF